MNETSAWVASARGGQLNSPSGHVISDRPGAEVPDTLRNEELGLRYTRLLSDKRIWGGHLNYGSASDKPFRSSDVTTINASAYYSFPAPQDPLASWITGIYYSNNSPVLRNFPIPFLAYFFKGPKLSGAIGVPFVFLRWTPSEDPWVASFFALGSIVRTEVAYGKMPFQKFVGFSWGQQTWLLHDRQNKDEKLYYDEKKVYVGTRLPLARFLFTDWQIGQSFDRSFYHSEGLWRSTSGRVTYQASWYTAWDLKFEF